MRVCVQGNQHFPSQYVRSEKVSVTKFTLTLKESTALLFYFIENRVIIQFVLSFLHPILMDCQGAQARLDDELRKGHVQVTSLFFTLRFFFLSPTLVPSKCVYVSL